jgi:predicted nucleic acid-binding protein
LTLAAHVSILETCRRRFKSATCPTNCTALSRRAKIESRLAAEDFDLHAPSHLYVELLSSLRNQVFRRGPRPKDEDVIQDFLTFPVIIHPLDILIPRIWQLRHNITPYDAAYVALAETLNAPLLTRDRKLATTKGHRARIEAI